MVSVKRKLKTGNISKFLMSGVFGKSLQKCRRLQTWQELKIKRPGCFIRNIRASAANIFTLDSGVRYAACITTSINLSAGTIANISLRGFASALSWIPITGAGSEHGRSKCHDSDNQHCLSHFRGYFKLKIKAWIKVCQVNQRSGCFTLRASKQAKREFVR